MASEFRAALGVVGLAFRAVLCAIFRLIEVSAGLIARRLARR